MLTEYLYIIIVGDVLITSVYACYSIFPQCSMVLFPISSWVWLICHQQWRDSAVTELPHELREQPRVHLQHTGAGWERNQYFCQNLPSGPGWHFEGISTCIPNFQAKVTQKHFRSGIWVSLLRLLRDILMHLHSNYTLILWYHGLIWIWAGII